jgi:hypothetical protein
MAITTYQEKVYSVFCNNHKIHYLYVCEKIQPMMILFAKAQKLPFIKHLIILNHYGKL